MNHDRAILFREKDSKIEKLTEKPGKINPLLSRITFIFSRSVHTITKWPKKAPLHRMRSVIMQNTQKTARQKWWDCITGFPENLFRWVGIVQTAELCSGIWDRSSRFEKGHYHRYWSKKSYHWKKRFFRRYFCRIVGFYKIFTPLSYIPIPYRRFWLNYWMI